FRLQPVRARLIDADVLLEKEAAGRDNWHLVGNDPTPRIGSIDVQRGTVRFLDEKARAELTIELQTVAPVDGDDRAPLVFRGGGILRGEAITLEGQSVGLAKLQDIDDPYRLSLTARFGGTALDFEGTVVPSDTENIRGTLRLQGPDLSKLYPIVPAPVPWT